MNVQALVDEIRQGRARPVYLFHGEEFLARKAAQEVVDALVDPAQRDFNLVVSDGASPAEVARELATLPMFSGTKVVWLQDPPFLAPKKAARADQLSRLRELWDQGKRREAARRLLALAQKAGIDAATAPADAWKEEAGIEASADDLRFCQEAASWAREEGIAAEGGDAAALERLLDAGLPPGSHLVISALSVDGRLGLVKRLQQVGAEISFRPAGRYEKRDVHALAAEFLAPLGKRIDREAAAALEELVGDDQVRRLHAELEKLALYVGDRPVIRAEDVHQVVERSRVVEFLLTHSIEKRDLAGSLEGLRQLLESGGSLPQAVASIATCLRQLLAAREATRVTGGSIPGFGAKARAWVEAYEAAGLRMPNPNAARFRAEAAARFGTRTLARLLVRAAEVDRAVKTGGGRLYVERLLWEICTET
ncbi:MAG: DNA polymerase III subunit delta [Pseudomonadota bacterium]